jgi:hypothetical protein
MMIEPNTPHPMNEQVVNINCSSEVHTNSVTNESVIMIALNPATILESVALFIIYDLELNNGEMMLRTMHVNDKARPVTANTNSSVELTAIISIAHVPLMKTSSKENKCFITIFFKGFRKIS